MPVVGRFGMPRRIEIPALVDAVVRAKPSGAKGQYIRTVNLAATMGPGVSLDIQPTLALASSES